MTSKIKGKYYPNLQVVMAMNYGSDYQCEFQFDDDAFIRRCIFFKYQPLKTDVKDYFKQNDYHPVLRELMNTGISFLDYELKKEDGTEFEQTTNLGSWYSFNQRLKNKANMVKKEFKDLTMGEVLTEFTLASKLYFNERSATKIQQKLQELLNVNVDIEKDIIAKGKIDKKYEEKKEDIYLKLKNFILTEPHKMLKKETSKTYIDNTIILLEGKGDYLIQIITELQKVSDADIADHARVLVDKFLDVMPLDLVENLTCLLEQ